MCGICGVFGRDDSSKLVFDILTTLDHRGNDGCGVASEYETKISNNLEKLERLSHESRNSIGHNLLSIVSFVNQPLANKKSRFAINCEIYNWKELKNKYGLKTKNDAETIFEILNLIDISNTKEVKSFLSDIDGVYSFAYWDLNLKKVLIARDIIGEKPLWYSYNKKINSFSFASERKALLSIGEKNIEEMNPRTILIYDYKKRISTLKKVKREFFKLKKNKSADAEIIKITKDLLINAIHKRVPEKKFGILFSGGIDSVFIAKVLKDLGYEFTCYATALDDEKMGESHDLIAAQEAASELGLNLKIKRLKVDDVKELLKEVVPLVEENNVVKVGVALTIYSAANLAKEDNVKVIFSGLGSEELFAGYARHKDSNNINQECLSGLLKLYERDLYRDDVVAMKNNMEIRLPFLDTKLVEYSLTIPEHLKLDKIENKKILRTIAQNIGIPEKLAKKKKVAAQYGSKMDRAIQRISEKEGLTKSQYLKRFDVTENLNLGVLWSGGKDSAFAMWTMMKQNYKIGCLISLKSKNQDSYMFHTPNIDLVEMHSEASGIPLIMQETSGEKEKELSDLKKALDTARKEHAIDGVVTGALYSDYQRKRIEKVCDELDLKIFSPLWHIDQEREMKQLLNEGFSIILSAVAAEGLDESWIGKEICVDDVEKLVILNKKYGLNVAGEGGEFESLVLDTPFFNKKIKIEDGFKKTDEDKQSRFFVEKATLEKKVCFENTKIEKYVELNAFIKTISLASTGGQAKNLIRSKQIKVNDIIETRNKRKLVKGDVVDFKNSKFIVKKEHARQQKSQI